MNRIGKILVKIADLSFFQIEVAEDILIDGKLYKNQKVRNNNSILTPANWAENVQVFFEQRMSRYKESYTPNEKIDLELEILEKLPINSQDYKILKSRYFEYLLSQRPSKENLKKKKVEELDEPKFFEDIFYNPTDAEECLFILNKLQSPVIDAVGDYIGKAKGVFPIWVKVLKSHSPKPLIKHLTDIQYSVLLNQRIGRLNLTSDASEFRKTYKRLENADIEMEMKTILSQLSHSGRLGK
jgi:hypothetical protein